MIYTLGELAGRFGLELKGDAAVPIAGVCGLQPGKAGHISFLNNPKLREALASTGAAAVIVAPRYAPGLQGAGLVAKDPYLAFARIAGLFDPDRDFAPGIHPSAVVATDVVLGEGVHIGPQAVIESGARIDAGAFIGAACHVGEDACVGEDARLEPRVYLHARVRIGKRCHIQPGAVIGSRGFGNAMGPSGWEAVPQLGSVVVGDDVEIGANTTIDRGAIEDTVIEDGVRLDNLIQIAHNCRIGAHTAIAACTGIAGSTRIGRRCLIGGAVGINGHIEIADEVVILGRAMVTHSLTEKGVYGSGLPVAPASEWRRTVARVRRLGRVDERLREIETRLKIEAQKEGADEQDTV